MRLLRPSACSRRPLPAGRQSEGTHALRLKKGCTGCTNSLGGGEGVSLIVLRELVSSFPAATWASRVQPVGTFLDPSGKKFTVSAGHAADARWAEPIGRGEGRGQQGRRGKEGAKGGGWLLRGAKSACMMSMGCREEGQAEVHWLEAVCSCRNSRREWQCHPACCLPMLGVFQESHSHI